MRNLFHRPTWRQQFAAGEGPLFYAVGLLTAGSLYALIWLAMALC